MANIKLGGTTAITESSGTLTYAQSTGILQVVHVKMAGVQSSTSTSFIDITDGTDALSVNITPLFNTSKILITISMFGSFGLSGSITAYSQLLRDSTVIHNMDGIGRHGTASAFITGIHSTYLDVPATTNQINYKLQSRGDGAGWKINARQSDSTNVADSTLTVMEIAVASL